MRRRVNSPWPQSAQIMRVVIKVGTSLIAPGGQIDINLLRGMVDQFDLSKNEYLIVTSGAIAAGMSGLGARASAPAMFPRMQACAAVGQSKLMHTYERLFFGKKVVAQLLLSSDDFTSPVRYRNLQNALAELLALGVVPIVNENDSVSVRELEGAFGDNDELSSLLATAVKADWLLAADQRRRIPGSQRTQEAAPAARGPQADSRARSAMQRQEFAGPRRHDLETARREIGQRRRRARRHREWTPSARPSRRAWNARSELIFRRKGRGASTMSVTTIATRRVHAGKAAARPRRVGEAGAAFHGRKECSAAGDCRRDRSAREKHSRREPRRHRRFRPRRRHARPPAADAGANQRNGAAEFAKSRRLPDPIGETLAEWTKSERPAHPQSARASGRRRHHLRIASERDRRYRRARAEDRQRHRAARRQRSGAAAISAWSRS